MKDAFQKDDGWNEDIIDTIGLRGFLESTAQLDYELKNCRRNSYAQFGDTGEDLMNYLTELKETLESVIEEADFYIDGKGVLSYA
jgi:hypothetical protein